MQTLFPKIINTKYANIKDSDRYLDYMKSRDFKYFSRCVVEYPWQEIIIYQSLFAPPKIAILSVMCYLKVIGCYYTYGRQFQEKCHEEYGDMYITFVDITEAFDTVHRKDCETPLLNLNVFLDLSSLFASYSNDQPQVRLPYHAYSMPDQRHPNSFCMVNHPPDKDQLGVSGNGLATSLMHLAKYLEIGQIRGNA